jgi:2-polyprenyl-3-methyl-5-hydroxy-6-metoxy-1,4-benzoquinol methylase
MSKSVNLLQEQIEYYRERASEYDEWFFRQGRYDRGEAHRKQWFTEITEVETFLRDTKPSGSILELACGTGLWTQHLAALATHVMAVDASLEVIALNQARVNSKSVEYIVADLFNWTPTKKFDLVFFGFWLSHVPMDRFVEFWQMVKDSLNPNGRVFFADSLFDRTSPAINHATLHQDGYSERKLNDGRVYQVVKIFHEPTQLEEFLQNLGWYGRIHSTPTHFIYGSICPKSLKS